MFGPQVATVLRQRSAGHHREPAHGRLLDACDAGMRALGVPDGWDVMFLTGSGTTAVETVLASLREPARGPRVRGEFTRRMRLAMEAHGVLSASGRLACDVALDTSTADAGAAPDAFFLDAVSSFPYHPIPPAARAWATVSSKQLGAAPVIGIVAVREDSWDAFVGPERFSVLNLARHRDAMRARVALHTPAAPLLADFAQRMEGFDVAALRRRIDRNAAAIVAALGAQAFVGQRSGPVLAVPKAAIPLGVAQRFELYGLRTAAPCYSIFTYSEAPAAYEELAEALRAAVALSPAA